MSKRPLSVKILFALPLIVTLAWAVLGAAQTNPFSTPLKVGQLMGMNVENSDGQKIGTLRNLVVDIRGGELKYAVIGSGGLFGVRSTLKLAPARIMSAGTAKRDTVAVFVTGMQWRLAPVFKASNLGSLADPGRAREIEGDFGLSAGTLANNSKRRLSITGRELEPTNAPPPVLKFASDLIGRRIVNEKQEKIGEVIDLLVSFGSQQRPAFAIISTGRFLRSDHEYAVPLRILKPTDSDRKWMLRVDAAVLQQAPLFTQDAWISPGTNGEALIYRYSKGEE